MSQTQEGDWKKIKKKGELVVERNRKIVNERIHYCWWNYLKLCLNLQEMKWKMKRLGRGAKILDDGDTEVKVNRKIYKDWDLKEIAVETSTFDEWYENPKHQKLFADGGFTYSRGSQYHALVKRFNTFILFHNKMNDDTDGGMKKDKMKICEDIIVESEKERYELLERDKWGNGTSFQKRVQKDLLLCENTIQSVCLGEFSKSSV